jgi:hypothetical protein
MTMDARQERSVYQKYRRISVLFVAKERQARKGRIKGIKSISNLFMAIDGKERSVSKASK